MMKRLQDMSIQAKLVGIFAVVFLAGVLTLGWNTFNLNHTQDQVAHEITTSRTEVRQALNTGQQNIDQAVIAGKDRVLSVFDITDELLFLRVIQLDFRELEGIEKDYVLAGDPDDELGLITAHDDVISWLEEDLLAAQEAATNADVRQTMTDLLSEKQYQDEFFYQLVALVQDGNVEEAQRLSLEGSDRKISNIYEVLRVLVNSQQDMVANDVDLTRAQMQDTLDQTRQQMETSISQTDQRLQQTNDRTRSQLRRAITISLITIGLFVLAGLVVVAVVLVVSWQIVHPVMEMANVASAIEKEELRSPEQSDQTLSPFARRQDEIGQLARVFQRMAKEVFTRVERLKQQVAELKIVIDEKKVSEQVSEITGSDYFLDLQTKAHSLRNRERARRPSETEPPPAAPQA